MRLANTIYEDARTSGNWFIVSAMGREAGHLAFGIGTACHYPMIIIPEMFNKTKVNFDKIVRLIISSVVKRLILNISYGAVIISEGVFHLMSDEEIESTGINFTYDEHGHPELGNVSKSHIFNMLLQHRLKRLDISVRSRPNEIGYELRCCRPIAYDLAYATLLGTGIIKLYREGKSGCMITVDPKGDVSPLYLKDVEDKNGKIKPRLVNIKSERVKMVFENNLHYINKADYKAVKKYLPDPENYDFKKILNW